MTGDDRQRIDAAVRRAFTEADMTWPPESDGPVPLDRMIGEQELYHAEVPDLTRAAAAVRIPTRHFHCPGWAAYNMRVAGFTGAAGPAGAVFVTRGDNLPRRRFTAAHELGHFLLHFDPEAATDELFHLDDSDDTIGRGEEDDDQEILTQREREANRFAAELLMPEPVIRRLCDQHRSAGCSTAPYLIGHIASDLLVSREAARWRLRELGITNDQ
jgi:hypothetical protein